MEVASPIDHARPLPHPGHHTRLGSPRLAARRPLRSRSRTGKTSLRRRIRLLRELEQLRLRGQAQPVAFATLYAGLGEMDAAFDWLETAYRLRDGYLFWLPGDPGLDPLHADPRFADLIHRMGIARS